MAVIPRLRTASESAAARRPVDGGCERAALRSRRDRDSTVKVLLFANTDWYLYNFRLSLARKIAERGHDVVLVSPRGRYAEQLAGEFDWREIDLGGGSKNPTRNALAVRQIRDLYGEVQPDLVHHFTIKCVLFGGFAARHLGIPAVHAVTGLGHVFTDDRVANRVLRVGVRAAYRHVCAGSRCRVIFQNEDDRSAFIRQGMVDPQRTHLIRGSGADCEHYRPGSGARRPGPCRLLFASRLIREKGIFELVEAVERLRDRGVAVELHVAGETYPGNPSSMTPQDVELLRRSATYHGHVGDMRSLFAEADIVALPSYAEGTPRVLLEAAACGKPLIATDIAGCRGVVQHGENGFLVPPRNSDQLSQAIERLARDAELRCRFGAASRRIVVEDFSESSVIERTLAVHDELLAMRG